MPSLIRKYSIGKNRILKGFMAGFTLTSEGVLRTLDGQSRHTLILGHIDSAEQDTVWGRLAFEFSAANDMVLVTRAFASNELEFIKNGSITKFDDFLLDKNVPLSDKEKLFAAVGASRISDADDILLYDQKGRYLWIFIDVYGAGEASVSNIRLMLPGDVFMRTFPEIYQKEGDFFHRYLSIFSSLYNDFQELIDSVDKLLDIDTAPEGLLPLFAEWLGIEVDGGILDSACLRKLIANAYPLLRVKGTKEAIMGIVRILTDDEAYIVEQRSLRSDSLPEDREPFEALYGKSPYEFTILINRKADEKLRSRLLLLVNQFKPAQSRVKIVFLGETCRLGSYCYLDVNARIADIGCGALDDGKSALNGMFYLQ